MYHFWSGYLGQSQQTLKKHLILKKGFHYGENLKNFLKFLSNSLKTSPNVWLLNWLAYLIYRELSGNLKILLITVGHMASCNSLDFFLEVWKQAPMHHFWIR